MTIINIKILDPGFKNSSVLGMTCGVDNMFFRP